MPSATLSGNEVSDAIRQAGREGDGLRAPTSQMGIYDLRQNGVANPGGESGVSTGWSVLSGCTLGVEADAKFGSYAIAINVTASTWTIATFGTQVGAPLDVQLYNLAAWVKGPAGRHVQIQLQEAGGAEANTFLLVMTNEVGEEWLEYAGAAMMRYSDRTRLDIFITCSDAAAGDQFILDGVRVAPGGIVRPFHLQATIVDTTNEVVDGDAGTFESGITGWSQSAGAATLTHSTEQAFEGTHSMLVVPGAVDRGCETNGIELTNGTVYALRLALRARSTSGVIRAAIADDLTGAIITFQDVSVTSAEWSEVEMLFDCGETKDYRLRFLVRDEAFSFFIDDVRVDGQLTDPRERQAGRIRLPATAINAVQGTVAITFSPHWNSIGRSSAVLWDWRDDANNRLTIDWSSGAFRMTRVASGVAATASKAVLFQYGDVLSVVGSWSAAGVSVSVTGHNNSEELTDTFTRGDSSDIGSAESGQAWSNTGDEPLEIVSNRLANTGTGTATGYAFINIGSLVRRIGGQCSWVNPQTTDTGVITIICSSDPTLIFEHMLHFFANNETWNLQWTLDGIPSLSVNSFARGQSHKETDGTVYDIWLTIDAGAHTVVVEFDDGTFVKVYDSRIDEELVGPLCVYELRWDTGTDAQPRWDSIGAISDQPVRTASTATASGTSTPTLAATTADVGSQAGASNYLDGDVFWVIEGRRAADDDALDDLHAIFTGDPGANGIPQSIGAAYMWPAVNEALLDFAAVVTSPTAGYAMGGHMADLLSTRRSALQAASTNPARLWASRKASIEQRVRERNTRVRR